MKSRTRSILVSTLSWPLLAMLSMSGCKEEVTWKQSKFKKHELLQSNSDPRMPEILWERIESVYTGAEIKEPEAKKPESQAEATEATEATDGAAGKTEAAEGKTEAEGKTDSKTESKSEAKSETAKPEKKPEAKGEGGEGGAGASGQAAELEKGVLPSEFAPLKVYLVEKNKGILHGLNHEIVFGPGGGELDLQDFVENRKGSFYFVVEFMPDVPIEKGSPGRKVFFLSNSVRRHGKAETIGNGCHNYFDITTSFEAAMKAEGYVMNTTDLRHVSALAGTFFFALKNDGKLQIAQLTIKDSSHRSLQCRR